MPSIPSHIDLSSSSKAGLRVRTLYLPGVYIGYGNQVHPLHKYINHWDCTLFYRNDFRYIGNTTIS